MQPILANRLYLPETDVPVSLKEQFRHHWVEKRHETVLDDEGEPVMTDSGPKTQMVKIDHTVDSLRHILSGRSVDWVGLPRGDRNLIRTQLRDAVDLRSVNPLGFQIKMAQHVLEDDRWGPQEECVDKWCQAGGGLVIGQTGAGKTLIGIGGVARMGLQTLILSKRGEGESHWEAEFREHTNINQLEDQMGHRLIGPYRQDTYPISIGTVQTFLHRKGYKRLIQDQFRFGLVIADEIHELVAPEFFRVFSLWAPLLWMGLTATIKRPDHREFLAYKVLGPIAAKLKADQMRPIVRFIETGFSAPAKIVKSKYGRRWIWNHLLKLISGDEARIECIVKHVMEDIDNGRLVAVVGERRQLLRSVYDELKQNGYDVAYADGSVPKARRNKIYEEVAKGKKYRCLCAGKVLDAMVSIKPLDCLHLVTPVSARHRIMQIFGRTRRPQEGKLIPLVSYYADEGGQLSGAYRNVMKVVEQEGWEIEKVADAFGAASMAKWRPKTQQSLKL